MIAIICGGRTYTDKARVFQVLDTLHSVEPFTLVRHGSADGADTLAGEWAMTRGIPCEVYAAQWGEHGKGAGPRRNQAMLDAGCDMVVAFPGGRGTEDMTQRGIKAGVRVVVVSG